jgi:condensin-2 complex subunit D3
MRDEEKEEEEAARDGDSGDESSEERRKARPRAAPVAAVGAPKDAVSSALLMGMLVARCSDAATSVRARALMHLASVAQALGARADLAAQWPAALALGSGGELGADVGGADGGEQAARGAFIAILHRRAADPRPGVRKAAMQALESLLVGPRTRLESITQADLQVFFDGCMDLSVAIRKQALSSLTEIFRCFHNDSLLHQVWLGAVLPLVNDAESTVQELCLKAVRDLLLAPVVEAVRATDMAATIWHVLDVANEEMVRYMQTAIELIASKQRVDLPVGLVEALNRVAADSTEKGVWVLLECLSAHMPKKVRADAVLAALAKCNACRAAALGEAELARWSALRVRMLKTLGNVAAQLPAETAAELASELFQSLASFGDSVAEVQVEVAALRRLCLALVANADDDRAAAAAAPPWEAELVRLCEAALARFVLGSAAAGAANGKDEAKAEDAGAGAGAAGERALTPQAVGLHLYTLGEVVLQSVVPVSVSQHCLTLVQSLLPPQLSAIASGAPSRALDASVRGHAFVALGKLCLKDQALAKRSITIFVRELESGDSPVIRNNVLVVMYDLCRTFTAVVDAYVPSMSQCIRDASPVIRRHALMVLAQLLQEDFLKWKPSLFLRFLTAVVDDDTLVSSYAEHALTSLVMSKGQNRFHMHFTECFFFLNACRDHPKYYQLPPQEAERERAFVVADAAKRARLYAYLLRHMTDEKRFTCAAKLCSEVLGAAVDGSMPLNEVVLRDVLAVLCSADMKLSSVRRAASGGGGGALDGEEDEAPAAEEKAAAENAKAQAMAAARGRIMSHLVRKNALENILPLLVELKRLLERRKSPLLGQLFLYFKELLADYAAELKDIFAADRQLAEEIEYDMRQFEQQQRRAAQEEELARLAVAPVLAPGAGSARRGRSGGLATPASPVRALAALPPSAITPRARGAKTPPPVFRTPSLRKTRAPLEAEASTRTPPGSGFRPRPAESPSVSASSLSRLSLASPQPQPQQGQGKDQGRGAAADIVVATLDDLRSPQQNARGRWAAVRVAAENHASNAAPSPARSRKRPQAPSPASPDADAQPAEPEKPAVVAAAAAAAAAADASAPEAAAAARGRRRTAAKRKLDTSS